MPTAPYSAAEVVEKNRRIADALRAKGGRVVGVRVDMNRFAMALRCFLGAGTLALCLVLHRRRLVV